MVQIITADAENILQGTRYRRQEFYRPGVNHGVGWWFIGKPASLFPCRCAGRDKIERRGCDAGRGKIENAVSSKEQSGPLAAIHEIGDKFHDLRLRRFPPFLPTVSRIC